MGKSVTATDLLRVGRRDSSGSGNPEAEPLDHLAASRLEDESTRHLDAVASKPLVAEVPPEQGATSRLGAQTPELLVVRSPGHAAEKHERTGQLSAHASERLGTESPASTGDERGTRGEGVQGPQTYERATVFLTPDQRKWLKATARALPVDGLSASDVVRLAVNRLRQDVVEGLALLEALSAQAHVEAVTHPGRRNRGLPPAAASEPSH